MLTREKKYTILKVPNGEELTEWEERKRDKKMQEKLKLKWLNKLQDIQLLSEIERQKSYLAEYLNRDDRMKSSDYIRYIYACINTCKVILKARKVNA